MRKAMMLMLMVCVLMCAPAAHAKKLSDVTAHDVAMVPYKTVRLVLKAAAQPFYWLEKLQEKLQESRAKDEAKRDSGHSGKLDTLTVSGSITAMH